MKVKRSENEKKIFDKIGKAIKFYRINHNVTDKRFLDEYNQISQEKLAEMIGSSVSQIRNLESPKTEQGISIIFLEKIANALNIPLYAFFLDKPTVNPPKNPISDNQ